MTGVKSPSAEELSMNICNNGTIGISTLRFSFFISKFDLPAVSVGSLSF